MKEEKHHNVLPCPLIIFLSSPSPAPLVLLPQYTSVTPRSSNAAASPGLSSLPYHPSSFPDYPNPSYQHRQA